MDTLSRSCVILVGLLFALTGYSQNMRTRSSTTTFATTNFGHATHSNLTASTAVTAPAAGSVVLLASNNTFFSLSSAGVLTDLGAAVAAGQIDTAKTVWVSTDGNDGTGIRGRQDKPFLTMTAGANAAQAGDLVWVRPGEYLATNALKVNVNYWVEGVLTNDPSKGSVANHDIFTDKLIGPTTNIIAGPGEYRMLYETNHASLVSQGILTITNAGSYVIFKGSMCLIRGFTSIAVSALDVRNCRYVFFEVDDIYDPDVDRQSFDPNDPETEIFSGAQGVFWQRGNVDVFVKRNVVESGYCVWGDEPAGGATNELYYNGSLARSTIGNTYYLSGRSDNYKMWIEVLNSIANNGVVVSLLGDVTTGLGGKFYLSGSQKLLGANTLSLTRSKSWITSQKFSLISGSASPLAEIFSGNHFIEGLQYEQEGDSTAPAMFHIQGGTNLITKGHLIATNMIGMKFSGSHSTRLQNMVVQTVNVSGSGNSNECILSITNGLKLHNIMLEAPASVNSIKSTNTLNPIIVEGTLQMNTAPGASVVFYGGPNLIGSTIVHNGADQFKILTNAFSGFNVFLDLATNTMQFLLVTNNFTLIPTNQNVGQRISFTMFNPTATSVTIVLPAVQIYGSGISNVVAAGKRLKSAWESQDAAVTNVSAAFAQQKN